MAYFTVAEVSSLQFYERSSTFSHALPLFSGQLLLNYSYTDSEVMPTNGG